MARLCVRNSGRRITRQAWVYKKSRTDPGYVRGRLLDGIREQLGADFRPCRRRWRRLIPQITPFIDRRWPFAATLYFSRRESPTLSLKARANKAILAGNGHMVHHR